MGRPLRRLSYVITSSSNDARSEERLEEHCLTFEDLNGARIGVGRNLALGAKLNPVPLWGEVTEKYRYPTYRHPTLLYF